MSGGGGTTVQSQHPWPGAQPGLRRLYSAAEDLFSQGGPNYFPGQTFVGPNQDQLAPYGYGFDFMNNIYGTNLGAADYAGPQDYTQAQPPSAPLQYTTGDQRFQRAFEEGGQVPDWQASPGAANTDGLQGGDYLPTPFQPQTGGPLPTAPNTGGFNYGNLTNANAAMLSGQTPAGNMFGQLSPMMMGSMQNAFGQGPSQIGDWQSGFQPGQTPWGFNWDPGSVGANPVSTLNDMMSGQPNYDMVQDAVRAGAQPTLDILREDIMPGLRTQTNALNNPTGEIKDTNRIVPRVMRDISNMGTQAALGEYNRAMGARERGAGMAGQLGLGYGGLGLDSSQFGAGLGENWQDRMMGTSQFNAGLGLQGDIAQAGAMSDWRNAALGLGGLTGELGQQMSQDATRGMTLFPQTMQMGMQPMDFLQNYGNFTSGYEQMGLQDAMNRWNYQQNQPYANADWFSGIMSGAGGLGGTMTQNGGSNPLLGAAGGMLGGAGLGSMMGASSLMGTPATAAAAAVPAMWPFLLGGGLLGLLGS